MIITNASGVSAAESIIDKSFATAEGYLEISPVFSENAVRDISVAIGLGDLSLQPRFSTHAQQQVHRAELNALLAARFREKTTSVWLAELEPKGVFCAKVNTLEEAIEDPQLAANGMVIKLDHAKAGTEVAPGHRNGVNHFLAEFIRQLPQLPGFQPAQIGRNIDLVEKRGFKRHENGSQSMNLK